MLLWSVHVMAVREDGSGHIVAKSGPLSTTPTS